jgi:NAD(P)-dependent dehydrogenase (short-subunit alcohol dehydrogenase family)
LTIDDFLLDGKRALVIAGGRGIGKGIATLLAEAGAELAVASRTSKNAEATAAEIEAAGGHAAGYAVDATNAEDMADFATRLLAGFGPPDIVVNCLGDDVPGQITQRPGRDEPVVTPDVWRYAIDLNLTEAYLGCHYFGKPMLERGSGTVINISGTRGFRARAGATPYSTAKAGLIHLTKGVALEWAPYNVTCNSIAPGVFLDREQLPPDEFARVDERVSKQVPLGRTGVMREIGLLAVYLASDPARYITGQTIVIDGGRSIA